MYLPLTQLQLQPSPLGKWILTQNVKKDLIFEAIEKLWDREPLELSAQSCIGRLLITNHRSLKISDAYSALPAVPSTNFEREKVLKSKF